MKREATLGVQSEAGRAGRKRGNWRRFSLVLLGGLVCMGLLSGAGKQVFAGPEQSVPGTTGMLATLSAQAREVVTEGARFASDVRLLYQISNLAPTAQQNPAFAEPADPKETSCKLISSEGSTANLRKAVKSRS